MGVIYKITSPTGRLYVGKTKHLGRRINSYKYKIVKNIGWKNSMIMNSLQKYGWNAHKFEIIEECKNEKLDEREIYWIRELDTYCFDNPRNMNMSTGGDGGAKKWMFDIERRKRQSIKFKGERNPFYGKTQNEEWRKKKSKEVSEFNKKNNINIPQWGAEKGRDIVRRPVICYDSNGDFIIEFSCAAQAERDMNLDHTSISMVCNRKRTHVGGFIFRYKTDDYPLHIDVGILNIKNIRKSVLMINNENKILAEFNSPSEASIITKVPATSIRRVCAYNHGHPLRNGMIFIYKKDFQNNKTVPNNSGELSS